MTVRGNGGADLDGDEAGRPPRGPDVDARALLDGVDAAVLVADGAGQVVLANRAAARLLGRDRDELVGRPVVDLVPPAYRPAHEAAFRRYVTSGRRAVVDGPPMRVAALRPDGTELPVELSLTSVGRPGEPGFAVVGTLREALPQLDLEGEAVLSGYLQATVDAARDGVLAWSPNGRVLAVNPHFCELWGLDPEEVRPGADAAALLARSLDRLADPQPLLDALRWAGDHPRQVQTLEVRLADGRVLEGYGAPITDARGVLLGRVWYVHDDTERRAAEAQRAALLAQLAAAQRAQQFLLDASAVLAHASGFAETLEALAAVAVPTLGDLCLIDVIEGGRTRRMAAVHADPRVRPLVEELRTKYAPDPHGGHPSLDAMRDRHSRWSPDMSDAFLRATTKDERHFRIVKELGFTSYMTVPLVGADEVLGAVTLVSAGSGRRFGPDDVALAEELAQRVALVVEKERRYDTERLVSHALQTGLLRNELPAVTGVEFAVRYLPGTADTEVGGDFWDVAMMPSGEVAVAVGDVAGHDITAAATMAQLRSACRALRAQTSGPEELVHLLHSSWDHLGLDRIATAVFARLEPHTGKLRIATAGHLPPLIVEADRAWFPTLDPAAPLGAPTQWRPVGWTGVLPPGSTVVFYTDGLVEDRHRDIDEGTVRLIRAGASSQTREPEALLEHILASLSGEDRADDVALLAVHRR